MATAQAAGALRRFPHSRRHGCCRCSPRRRAVACRSTPQRTRAATPRRTSPPLAAASSSRSSSCAWVRRWGFPTATASPRSTQCRRLFPPWASLRAPPHLLQPFSLFLSSLSPPALPPPPPAFLRCPPLRRAATRRGRFRCYSSRRSRSLRRGRPTGWCRPASSASYRSTAPTRAWLASTIAATADAACARSARRAAPRSRSSARHKRNACASSASAPFPKTQAKAPECGFVNLV